MPTPLVTPPLTGPNDPDGIVLEDLVKAVSDLHLVVVCSDVYQASQHQPLTLAHFQLALAALKSAQTYLQIAQALQGQ